MKYIDYYIFSIYNTYKKLHRRAPRMIYGEPEFNAASVAALYPVLLIFSASLLFNVWGSLDLMVYQFLSFCLLFISWGPVLKQGSLKLKQVIPCQKLFSKTLLL